MKYKRVLLKLSGEALLPAGSQSGIGLETADGVAGEIAEVARSGVQIAVVIGGGNIFRGAVAASTGAIERAQADTIGMLATVINGLALQSALERTGLDVRLMTATNMPSVAEHFIRRRALAHLDSGRVLVFADPVKDPKAVRFDSLTYVDVLTKRLRVMDATAISMCMDHNLPVIVFDMFQPRNLRRVVKGEKLGTIIYG